MEKIRKSIHLSLILVFFFEILSCTHAYKPKAILKKWKVSFIEIIKKDKKSSADSIPVQKEAMAYPIFYQFNENGTYTLTIGNQSDTGNWKLSTDEKALVLKSISGKQDDAEFLVEELNAYHLVISTEIKSRKEIFTLIPAEE